MKLWRISNYADLSGTGGMIFSGRWHNKGKPIVYTAEHPALAMLEILVHFASNKLPDTFKLLEIDLPDSLKMEKAKPKSGWQADESLSRSIGDTWLSEQRTAILEVPSILIPNAHNFLINPRHEDITKIRIVSEVDYPFDKRLKF